MATAARLVIKGNGQSDYKSPLTIVINTYIKKQNKVPYFSIDNARVIYTKKV